MSDENTHGGVNGQLHLGQLQADRAAAAGTAEAAGTAGAAAASDNVRECPVFADARFAPHAQIEAGLSDAQLRAIELLVTGTSQAKVAKACGVDTRTIYRWRHEHDVFRIELDRARRATWTRAMDRLRALIARSLSVLEEELDNEYDRSRMWAAKMVLDQSGLRKLMVSDMPDREE